MRARLCLSMIVRDEAAMLPGLIESVAGLWDEFVVVDTGSVDATPALLSGAGARVVHATWNHDFAAARNLALEHAVGEVVLVLDADERLLPGAAATIRAALTDDFGAATLRFQNPTAAGLVRESRLLRLFPNHPDVRFRHRIHEDASESVERFLRGTGRRMVHLPATVLHLGYERSVAAERQKRERDLFLLGELLREAPDDLYAHYKRLQVARFWNDAPAWAEAATAASAALTRCPGSLSGLHTADDLVVMIARAPGGPHAASARAWIEVHAARIAPTSTLEFWLGCFAEEAGDPKAAAAHYARALTVGGARDPQFERVRPRLGLARLALGAGEFGLAAEHASAAVAEAPRDPEALAITVFCARRSGRLREVVAALFARADPAAVRRAAANVGVQIPA